LHLINLLGKSLWGMAPINFRSCFLSLTLPAIFALFATPKKMTEDGDAFIFIFKAHESTV